MTVLLLLFICTLGVLTIWLIIDFLKALIRLVLAFLPVAFISTICFVYYASENVSIKDKVTKQQDISTSINSPLPKEELVVFK